MLALCCRTCLNGHGFRSCLYACTRGSRMSVSISLAQIDLVRRQWLVCLFLRGLWDLVMRACVPRCRFHRVRGYRCGYTYVCTPTAPIPMQPFVVRHILSFRHLSLCYWSICGAFRGTFRRRPPDYTLSQIRKTILSILKIPGTRIKPTTLPWSSGMTCPSHCPINSIWLRVCGQGPGVSIWP